MFPLQGRKINVVLALTGEARTFRRPQFVAPFRPYRTQRPWLPSRKTSLDRFNNVVRRGSIIDENVAPC